MTDRRTPLARALGRGSAKEGTGHWWSQRTSAVALLLLGAWFLISLSRLPGFAYGDVAEWLGRPFTAVLMVLMVLCIAWHSDLGLKVVIEDYVHQPFLKIATIVVVRFLHVFLAAAAVLAVLRMSVGAGT